MSLEIYRRVPDYKYPHGARVYRIIETYQTSDGLRTRVLNKSFSTESDAQDYIDNIKELKELKELGLLYTRDTLDSLKNLPDSFWKNAKAILRYAKKIRRTQGA